MIKYNIVYNYDRTKKLCKDGTASVLIRAYLDNKNRFFNIGIYIRPDQWDKTTSSIVHHSRQQDFNSLLKKEIELLEDYEFRMRRIGETITLKELKNYKGEKKPKSFLAFFWEQLEKEKTMLIRASYTDQRQTFYKLEEYRSKVFFKNLNYKLIDGFNTFLFQKGLSTNTVGKHHKNLKKYINLAVNLCKLYKKSS